MSLLEEEMSVSWEINYQALHRLSVTGFLAEMLSIEMVVVGPKEQWIGYSYKYMLYIAAKKPSIKSEVVNILGFAGQRVSPPLISAFVVWKQP